MRLTFRIHDRNSESVDALMARTRAEVDAIVSKPIEDAKALGYEVETGVDYFVGYPS